ncbi:MAG: carboxypeptidase-like regulatory domain-containing protein [Bryobacteraceae bacterium]
MVTDQGGAAVPNVKVSPIDQATGELRSTISNDVGEYTFTAVFPAT